MLWIVVTIFSFLLNATSNVINKILLTTTLRNPFIYAFVVSLLQAFAWLLIPFGFQIPTIYQISISLIAGITFTIALLNLFIAFTKDEATKVLTISGGIQPIFVFLFAYLFLYERLSFLEGIAFILLISGTVLISYEKVKKRRKHFQIQGVWYAILAALFFAISFSLTKEIFQEVNFITGFVLTRTGAVIGGILLLSSSETRKIFKQKKTKSGIVFFLNQILGAISFTLLFYAISLASVTLVTAFNGIQYAFTFILVLLLYKKYPSLLERPFTRGMIITKSFAIILIMCGIAILSLISVDLLI